MDLDGLGAGAECRNESFNSAETSKSPIKTRNKSANFDLAFSRDEMNLVEFPLAVLSTRVNPKIKTLEFRDIQRLRTGQVIEKEWIITGADKFGLPTATDDDVVLGLMKLSYDNDFRERKVFFSRYELLKTLRWSTEGRSYSRLNKSLDRLSGVRIRTKNGFFNNNEKAYQTRNFGIIDVYEINDSRGGKGAGGEGKKPSYFVWSDVLFNSFHANYIKKIDLDLYFGLKSSVSRRLYRYLDKHTYRSNRVEKPLLTLAFEKLGLSRSYKYVSSIKQQLEPAFEELEEAGYLEGVEYLGKGAQTKIRFIRTLRNAGGKAVEHPLLQRTHETFSSPAKKPQLTGAPSQAGVAKELARRGLSLNQARKLLSDRKASEIKHIEEIIRYFDSLVASSDIKVSRNPVGFLYRAVENPENFTIPGQFWKQSAKEAAHESMARPERVLVGGTARKQASQAQQAQANPSPEKDSKQEYQRYVDAEIERLRHSLSPQQIQSAVVRSEEKMSHLKDVLDGRSFKAGLKSCIKVELVNLLGLPSFHEWVE